VLFAVSGALLDTLFFTIIIMVVIIAFAIVIKKDASEENERERERERENKEHLFTSKEQAGRCTERLLFDDGIIDVQF
jgi:hypothetical protein